MAARMEKRESLRIRKIVIVRAVSPGAFSRIST